MLGRPSEGPGVVQPDHHSHGPPNHRTPLAEGRTNNRKDAKEEREN